MGVYNVLYMIQVGVMCHVSRVAMLHVYNVLFMVQRGEISEQLRARSLVTYVAGLFRSIRFGVAESHGRGAALQLNTFLGSGAVTLDSVTGRYSVQLARLEQSVAGLVARLCTLQHTGDREVSVSAKGREMSSSLFVSRRWRPSWRGWAGWTR